MRALQYVKRTKRAVTAIKSFIEITSAAGQRVKNPLKLPGVFRIMLRKAGH